MGSWGMFHCNQNKVHLGWVSGVTQSVRCHYNKENVSLGQRGTLEQSVLAWGQRGTVEQSVLVQGQPRPQIISRTRGEVWE